MLQTECEFTLPCGYIDAQGTLHREGVMRRSTALDEVEAMQDARVRENQAYVSILLLSRVVSRLGELSPLAVEDVEQLFSTDFVYLQELFVRLNDVGDGLLEADCPACGSRFVMDVSPVSPT